MKAGDQTLCCYQKTYWYSREQVRDGLSLWRGREGRVNQCTSAPVVLLAGTEEMSSRPLYAACVHVSVRRPTKHTATASVCCCLSASSLSSLSAPRPAPAKIAAVSRSDSLPSLLESRSSPGSDLITHQSPSSPPSLPPSTSALTSAPSLYLPLAFTLSLRLVLSFCRFNAIFCSFPLLIKGGFGASLAVLALLSVRLIFPLAAMVGGFQGRSSSIANRGVEQVCTYPFFLSLLPEHCGTPSRSTRKTWPAASALLCFRFCCSFQFRLCILFYMFFLFFASLSLEETIITLHFIQNKACALDSMNA